MALDAKCVLPYIGRKISEVLRPYILKLSHVFEKECSDAFMFKKQVSFRYVFDDFKTKI
jgi:hypothetical protein